MTSLGKPNEWEVATKPKMKNNSLLLDLYKKHQLLLVRNFADNKRFMLPFFADMWRNASTEARQAIQKSWYVETDGRGDTEVPLAPETILGVADEPTALPTTPWYCSFVPQGDEELLGHVLDSLPTPTNDKNRTREVPSFLTSRGHRHEDAAWVFIAKQTANVLPGRPEHVDKVTHDGTWHLQCSGEKTWYIRSAAAFHGTDLGKDNDVQHGSALMKTNSKDALNFTCRAGDLLVINTRSWAHRTEIPAAGSVAVAPCFSISIARDFFFHTAAVAEDNGDDRTPLLSSEALEADEETEMGNVDALFADRYIAKGEVVYTDEAFKALSESGEGGLAFCLDPNCEVQQIDDGTYAIVAIKNIRRDDFITLLDVNGEENVDGTGEPRPKKART